jgi:sarcosine oxidase gamma subunit
MSQPEESIPKNLTENDFLVGERAVTIFDHIAVGLKFLYFP